VVELALVEPVLVGPALVEPVLVEPVAAERPAALVASLAAAVPSSRGVPAAAEAWGPAAQSPALR